MDRTTVYYGELPRSVDFLGFQKNALFAFGRLASLFMAGNDAMVNGMGCTPGTDLSVQLAPGELYTVAPLDATPWGTLPSDPTPTVQQAILYATATVSLTAPSSGTATYYISVGLNQADTTPAVLPYLNSSNPTQPYAGPGNTNVAEPTLRQALVSIQASTNATPAAGYVNLYTVTVAAGATSLTGADISAPLVELPQIHSVAQTFEGSITQVPGAGVNNETPFAQYADLFSDAIMSGLTTTTSSTLSSTLAAGDAYVIGQRVVYPGSGYTVAASSTSYLDLSNTGVLTVSTSATVTANSLRLWEVVSSATAITGVTQVAPSGAVIAGSPVVSETIGDGRYGQLGAPNQWSGLNQFAQYNGIKAYMGITTNTTLTAADSGKVIIVGGGPTIIIPGLGAGAEFEFIVNAPSLGSSNNTAFLNFPGSWLYHAGIGFIAGNAGGNGTQNATYELSGSLRYVKIAQDSGGNWNIVEDNDISSFSTTGTINPVSVSSTDSATLTGTTAGTIVSSMPEQGVMKKFGAYANAYENDTTTAQTITFPTPFSNSPTITTNETGLSLSASTTELTINAPDNTTTYTGLIIVEGF